MSKPKIIAFYLPQFYPTQENDEWWEPGFTEWTNVAKAKPLYPGHYQPKLPGELGFYDLRLSETRQKQAELAQEYGIDAFCYWHYWFEGRRLLSDVFEDVIKTGKPDFPFCLCWANHSWYKKTWSTKTDDKLLVEQTYGGIEDYKNHFFAMLPAFKDERYFKIDGKLVFGFYAPLHFDDISNFMKIWNELAKQNNIPEFWFFAYTRHPKETVLLNSKGFKNIVVDLMHTVIKSKIVKLFHRIPELILNLPKRYYYDKYIKINIEYFKKNNKIYPCILPNYDHSPRSGRNGIELYQSTPIKWGILINQIKKLLSERKNYNEVIFIKSWNEWGEGNYLEPDRKFKRDYLDELKRNLY